MKTVKIDLVIRSCSNCPRLLTWRIGDLIRFKWTCLEMLREVGNPSGGIPDWCPFEDVSNDARVSLEEQP